MYISLNVLWHCLSLELERKVTFSSPVVLAEFSKFAGILSAALSVVQFSSVQSLSFVQLFATPWTVAYQAPPSMGFSRQEYWSALLFPSPGDLPNPGIESGLQRV